MQPSPLVDEVIAGASSERMQGVRMIMQRADEFPSMLQAQLTGVGLDPQARNYANAMIDQAFGYNRPPVGTVPEIVIGSGFHAATYAATRYLAGKPVPYVFERATYAGGAFAVRAADGTYPGVFTLNSRNRRGNPGLSGDNEAQLNYLPGAPIQASALSNAEYQTNADMAFVIRMTLAQYAPDRVFPGVTIQGVERDGDGFLVTYRQESDGAESVIRSQRIIDARGLGDPVSAANGTTVLTFPQFLQRMSEPWPLRGLRNVAVLGGGDSGKCTVESLLGLGPSAFMASAELDSVNRVDWYATGVADTYDEYCQSNRGRYRAIGRYLRPDKMGNQRLTVFQTRDASPVALPGGPVLVNGRSYDLVIVATGNRVLSVPGLDFPYTANVYLGGTRIIATRNDDDYGDVMRYRIGPRAGITFDRDEIDAGVADIDNNRVAMFRLATRSAALAVQLD